MFGPHPDDLAPLATMSDAHREWHLNAGVPMGQPGCPQDACHPDYDEEYEAWLADSVEQAPQLREGEEPAAPRPVAYGPEPAPVPGPFDAPWSFDFDPPF